jgi:Ca2+-binding RTX toxin-like protein
LRLGAGDDLGRGGRDDDRLDGGRGIDRVYGGAGHDVCRNGEILGCDEYELPVP